MPYSIHVVSDLRVRYALARVVRQLRNQLFVGGRRMSLRELAQTGRLHHSTIFRIEHGRNVEFLSVWRMADMFQLPLSELMRRVEEKLE